MFTPLSANITKIVGLHNLTTKMLHKDYMDTSLHAIAYLAEKDDPQLEPDR
jgi:hypothetical protein